MFNFIRKRLDKKGFTLVELLVVIAVLGIIAGIAIPRMSGVTDTFRQKADEETARNLARQVQIRIQAGTTIPPATGSQRILLTSGGANTLGEVFTKTPQFKTGLSNGSRIFVVYIDKDNITVLNSPADTVDTATPAVGSENLKLQIIAHGGPIQ